MDVRCERCRAQYVFDDDQVTPGGLTVQCTNCGHVFKVKVKELVVTVPVKPGEMDEAPIPATAAAPKPPSSAPEPAAPAAPSAPASPVAPGATSFLPKPDEKGKEWRVRQANGNLFTFKELTTLQKWIVEQKVSRDDEISLSGDQWKRLGNIAELASFFQVVQAAESARTQAAMPAVTPIPMPTVSVYPVVQAPPGYPGAYPPPGYPPPSFPPPPPSFAIPPPPVAPPVPGAAPPTAPRPTQAQPAVRAAPTRQARAVGRAVDVPLTESELGTVKRGQGGKILVLVLLLVAGAAAALWAWKKPQLLALLRGPKPEEASVPLTIEVKPPVTPPSVGDSVTPPPEKEPAEPSPGDAAPLPAPVQEGEAPLPKAPVPVPVAKPEPPPAPRGPKQLLAEAQRLRTRGSTDKALDLYERVLEAQPTNAHALAGRGLCYLDLQQYALAEQSFRTALQADPEEADALLGLAEAARYQGRKSEAIQHYERYLALHPDGEDAVAARNAINQLKE
jgi:predicted Zn finger-like uncharacterized protein